MLLEKNNDDNHLNLIFKENNEILGLVAINILNETGIVYSIVLKSKELLKETNSNGFNEHSIRMEKEL